ncbi:hypothetical protein ACSBR1_004997 [Camellia fascicularis]
MEVDWESEIEMCKKREVLGYMENYALVLAKAGIRVSYVSTPRNIQRLPQLPPELSSLVTFVPISLPSLGSNLLPEGAEATVDITADKMGHLKAAFDLLKQRFKHFVAEKSPDWIVTDAICSWTVDVAEECHVPAVIFSPVTAAIVCSSDHRNI